MWDDMGFSCKNMAVYSYSHLLISCLDFGGTKLVGSASWSPRSSSLCNAVSLAKTPQELTSTKSMQRLQLHDRSGVDGAWCRYKPLSVSSEVENRKLVLVLVLVLATQRLVLMIITIISVKMP